MQCTMKGMTTIHVNWSATDRAYEVPDALLLEFYNRVKKGEKICPFVDLLRRPGVKETVGIEFADYFLDCGAIKESVLEWELV